MKSAASVPPGSTAKNRSRFMFELLVPPEKSQVSPTYDVDLRSHLMIEAIHEPQEAGIFWDPLVAWRSKKATRKQTVAAIAGRYREFVDLFEKARS